MITLDTKALSAARQLIDDLAKTFDRIEKACSAAGIKLEDFLAYFREFLINQKYCEKEHARTCHDYACKNSACRVRRGLKPVKIVKRVSKPVSTDPEQIKG